MRSKCSAFLKGDSVMPTCGDFWNSAPNRPSTTLLTLGGLPSGTGAVRGHYCQSSFSCLFSGGHDTRLCTAISPSGGLCGPLDPALCTSPASSLLCLPGPLHSSQFLSSSFLPPSPHPLSFSNSDHLAGPGACPASSLFRSSCCFFSSQCSFSSLPTGCHLSG